MPVLKLHLAAEAAPADLGPLGDELRHAVVEELAIDQRFGKVIIYTTPLDARSVHPQRNPRFAFAELWLFAGRPPEVKQRLMARLTRLIAGRAGLEPEDVFIALNEAPRHDWSRGGASLDQVELGY